MPARDRCLAGVIAACGALDWVPDVFHVNDYHTACSAPVSNNNKATVRCAKETVLYHCAGDPSCTYVGTANGCGSGGHTCLYALCM